MTDLREHLQSSIGPTFTIERELGGGGMSRVFVAHDERLRRKIVIKVLSAELAQGLSVERFEREILLAAGLQHPYIVPVLDTGSLDGLPYYTMPFVEGQSLRKAMSASLASSEALTILRDVVEALEYAHARGVVHRDIKPENVLLNGRAALVTDFGIAKALSAAAAPSPVPNDMTVLTQIGTSLGTPAYMSPEQAAGYETADHRADFYSWGVMSYEALAGEHPFADCQTLQALIVAHFTETPVPLAERCPTLSPAMASIVMQCLEKDPDLRPSSAAEIIAAMSSADASRVTMPARARTPATSMPKLVGERSIVVIPFANVSPEPDNEYFSDGLTDELIADLSRVKALKVISRTSSMLLKGVDKGPRAIGKELGVRYVLEGTVRRAGQNIRITARLVEAETDTQSWSEKYSGVLDDVFDLQERISREIVRALDVTLSSDEDRGLAQRSIDDPTAYDCYLRARHELAQASVASLDRAAFFLERGLEIVGENARLRANLAYLSVLRMRTVGRLDAEVLDAAASQAHDILRREPGSGAAHFLLGTVEFERGHLQSAAHSLQAALRADPHDSDSAIWLGIVYLYAGQVPQARAGLDHLRKVDPLSPFSFGLAAAAEWFDGNFEAGLAPMAKCLELSPESTIWRWHWGYQLALSGRIAECSREAEHLWRSDPGNPYSRQLVVLSHALTGDLDAAREAIGPFEQARFDPHLTFHVAECFALIGDVARAVDLVAHAVSHGFYPHAFIARYDPFLEGLRADTRFQDTVREAQRRWRDFTH